MLKYFIKLIYYLISNKDKMFHFSTCRKERPLSEISFLKKSKKESKKGKKRESISSTKSSKKILLKAHPNSCQKSKCKLDTGVNFENEKNTKNYHLDKIASRSRYNQNYMQKLGSSFKDYKLNLQNEEIANNLSKISTNRSLNLAKSIKKIDRMNKEFDFKYYDSYNLNYYNLNKNSSKEKLLKLKNKNYLTEINEVIPNDNDDNKNIFEEAYNNNDLKNDLLKDEKEINYKQLIRRSEKKLSKELIQQKKLKDLETLLKYIDKQDEIPSSNNNKSNHHKPQVILTYSTRQNYSNNREHRLNTIYQPSISYNKNNLFFEKKYSLIFDKLKHKNKENYTIDEENKDNNNPQKNDFNEFNNVSSLNSIRSTSMKSFGGIGHNLCSNKNINNNNNSKKNIFVKRNNNHDNTNSTTWTNNTNSIFKPKTKYSSKTNKYNDQESYNNSFFSNIYPNNNNSEPIRLKSSDQKKLKNKTKDKIVPLVNELITEGDEIDNEIRLKVKSLNGLNASDVTAYNKRHKNHLNVAKIRKSHNLYNVNPIINEENILLNNAKKVGKTLTNRQKTFLYKVARTVIREDTLANKFVDCDHSLMFKLNFLNERRKNRSKFFMIKDNQHIKSQKSEIQKLFKVMKHNLPNYCSLRSLQSLIYKYRTLRFSPSKVV